jgi:hypothetical protein
MLDVDVITTEATADWIETCLLVSGASHFGIDKLNELALSELGLPPQKVSMALRAMAKRGELLADVYPFQADDLAVARRASPYGNDYATLLFLTPGSVARQTVRGSETSEMGELLEAIAERALANFWGAGGSALRFGHPSVHGRPQEFHLAIPWLANRMGLTPGQGYRPPWRKDGGVDVVAWRPFLDRRAGFPIALAQCTMQAETYTKTSDVDLRLWASWLAMDSDPLSLLVIPGTIPRSGTSWGQLTTVVMVIERLRLMELLARGGETSSENDWATATIGSLRQILAAGEL